MQIGCGVYEHTVKGRPYTYFWHYETKGARRVQVKEYIGPARAGASRAKASRLCAAYFRRMGQELRILRKSTLASVRRG